MDKEIEEHLQNPTFSSQQDLKTFTKKLQTKILLFEQQNYDAEDENDSRIKMWRSKLLEIIKQNKELPEENIEDSNEKEGIETLRLLNRQLNLADSNQKILCKSSLKLVGLDYSSSDIEKAIIDTRKKLENSKRREKDERKRLFYSFVFFIAVCIYIIADKIRLKF